MISVERTEFLILTTLSCWQNWLVATVQDEQPCQGNHLCHTTIVNTFPNEECKHSRETKQTLFLSFAQLQYNSAMCAC